jgi:putative hydrolase of the HAD superfamily
VDNAGIRGYFDFVLSSAACGIRKPNPSIFEVGLEHWRLVPSEAVMVGDTLGADILGARNAGIYSIWITRRADRPSNRDHAGTILPDDQIETLAELPEKLDSM